MSIYRRFDSMCWAAPGQEMSDLAHKLRYDGKNLSQSELYAAATVVECYEQLIGRSAKRRAEIIRELRQGPNLPHALETKP